MSFPYVSFFTSISLFFVGKNGRRGGGEGKDKRKETGKGRERKEERDNRKGGKQGRKEDVRGRGRERKRERGESRRRESFIIAAKRFHALSHNKINSGKKTEVFYRLPFPSFFL